MSVDGICLQKSAETVALLPYFLGLALLLDLAPP